MVSLFIHPMVVLMRLFMVEGGGLGGLDQGWVIRLNRWYFWPTVMVEGDG